jgi:hypothetical protein
MKVFRCAIGGLPAFKDENKGSNTIAAKTALLALVLALITR